MPHSNYDKFCDCCSMELDPDEKTCLFCGFEPDDKEEDS